MRRFDFIITTKYSNLDYNFVIMLTKEAVNKQIKELPDEFTLDELIEKLLIIDKVNRGLLDVEEGRTVSETELDKRMAKWFS